MKYSFDMNDLPNKDKRWIIQQRNTINELVEKRKKIKLGMLEDEWLEQWNHWREEIDRLALIRKPNIREQILLARFEFTKYDEALKYSSHKNPYSAIKGTKYRELVLD